MVDPASFDAEAFSTFEHEGWQRVAQYYNGSFANLTLQAAEPLLDAANVAAGMDVLDVASGRGDVAALAARRGASSVGVDFSIAMVREARQRYPHIEFQEGNAEALPFANDTFDALLINFGLLHFSKPEQALREALRVLRSGSKLSFTVWAPPEQAIGFGIVLDAVAEHGTWQVALPLAPHTFHFSDMHECARTLLELGFVSPTITYLPLVWELCAPDNLFRAMLEGSVRSGSLLRAQEPKAQLAIRKAIEDAAKAYEKGGKVRLPMLAILASALKP